MNYRLVAVEVGDLVKWESSVNEIRRTAEALFDFKIESFPNDAITSVRAQLVYDCVMSLAKQKMSAKARDILLVTFCKRIVPEDESPKLDQLIEDVRDLDPEADLESTREFAARGFHREVIRHCQRLFIQGNYFHAVFEACKVYNKLVQAKSKSERDGVSLMLSVWGCENGVLKVTRCADDTDKNVQDGIKFLSAGLMRAMRNPAAHEPALDWPIEKQDCSDMLSFVSFLFRQLDQAVYFAGPT